MARPLIVGLGGTARDGSQTELALGAALRAAAQFGADVVSFSGEQLILPIYAHGSEPALVAQRLIAVLRRCDGLIISTPSYHGGISGMIKNALDYIEVLRDDARPYLHGRSVGTMVCAGGWQSVGATLTSMRTIIHALRGWPTPMGVGINTQHSVFDRSGECAEGTIRNQIEIMSRQVVEFARMQMWAQSTCRPKRTDIDRALPADFGRAITAN